VEKILHCNIFFLIHLEEKKKKILSISNNFMIIIIFHKFVVYMLPLLLKFLNDVTPCILIDTTKQNMNISN
jgi:hypothetical protein